MEFMYWIVEKLNDVANFFYDAALEVWDWEFIGPWLGNIFYQIHDALARLSWEFYYFSDWVEYIHHRVAELGLWPGIKELILEWLPGIESALTWYSNWWLEVRANISNWWSGTIVTVQGWIDLAVQPFNAMLTAWTDFWNNLWPDLVSAVDGVWYAWSNFWNNIYPSLVSFSWLTTWWNSRVTEVAQLIDTAFTLRESLWAGWLEVRDQVIEFFTDPWSWLYDRLDDFIERFW